MNLVNEAKRTNPDYLVYCPQSTDQSTGFTGNEHFLVERLANGHLAAVWTRSSIEGASNQHIAFSRSFDEGRTWTEPTTIAGADPERGLGMASWAFPIVARSGRIYVFFSRHQGINDLGTHTTGRMACLFTDNEGESWSDEVRIPMPSSCWDNPNEEIPPNWIVWQKPIRLKDGKFLTGFTRWVSPARMKAPLSDWWSFPSVVEFMRFENIDDNPLPQALEITFLLGNEKALQIGLAGHPEYPVIQEPSIVHLPDGRLFCIMRTTQGSPYYSLSENQGEEWSQPLPLRQYDDGPVLPHPLSPCPIYALNDSEYVFFYHNHDGHFLNWTPADTSFHRRPICLAHGEFRANAKQPIWFSEPWYFMDNGGISILRNDMAMYSSVTESEEGLVLWYPDRKFFLLGKNIHRDALTQLRAPDRPLDPLQKHGESE